MTGQSVAWQNGWRGFDGMGTKTEGGWLYRCDGMPSQMGCGGEIVVTRRYARIGMKSTGWLVCYGLDDDGGAEKDVVLMFCPKCAVVVLSKEADR